MTDLPHTAAEYAEMAEQNILSASQHTKSRAIENCNWWAGTWATLALAAATLEAARLTIDAQASNLLSALEEPEPRREPGRCPTVWGDADAPCPDAGARGGHWCDGTAGHPDSCICSCGDHRTP